MARKRNRSRKRGFSTQTVYKLVRLGALALPAVVTLTKADSMENKLTLLARDYMGYDIPTKTFRPMMLLGGYGPALGATLATYGIPKIASLLRSL